MEKKRDQFQSKKGFIIACIGSAVGMGNIWLFPYRVGSLGGAAFLIPYFLFVILVGYTGIVEEMSFGRAMKRGPLGAFRKTFERKNSKSKAKNLGWIPVVGSFCLAVGYTVVVAWILRFLFGSFTGMMFKNPETGAYFSEIAGNFGAIFWHILAIIITFLIMVMGISKGIEKVNKLLIPVFYALFVILAIRVFFLDGSNKGYEYLLKPDFSKLLEVDTWVFALGQAFFSLSLAGSGTVVYGSYLSDDENIPQSAKYIAIFDVLAALLAAFVILPAVFAYNIEPSAGPPLMFITMPEVFRNMPLGLVFSTIFFLAVTFAGLTSLINLYETPVEALSDKFDISRKKSLIINLTIALIIGAFIEEANRLGMWMDIISIYAIPLGALLSGIMFLWICEKKFVKKEVSKGYGKIISDKFYNWMKYGFVLITAIVIIINIIYGGIG
ncbi:MAG: sodium-dependent transporter [Tissierellia bacterium]|nr:sodium-dependent transporter [Tissierellia bacterium]